MAIIGKLMGTRPSMSAPRVAPRPSPVVSRPSLDFLTGGQPKQTIPADALDRDTLIQDILRKIQVPTAPVFDPTRLEARLAELEGRQAPVFDPSALQEQIAELQNREAPAFDPSELQKQISDLRQRPSRDDFMSIERQLQDLRNRDIPQFDASGLQSQIGGLEDRLANLPQFDPSALQSRLAELEGREVPTIDREALIKDITGRIKQPRPFDPTRIRERLAALENRRPAPARPLFDPSRLQARLDALESREPVAPPPAFDPSSLQERLSALENVEPVAPPAFDTSAIDQRLEDITRQLAELQSAQAQPSPTPVVPPVQPLPIQPPGDLNLDIKEDAPDIRDLAKELPEGGTIFDRLPVQKPTPPMSIERLGEDRLVGAPVGNLQMGEGVPFTPPEPPQDDGTMNDRPRIGNYGLEREPQPSLTIPVSGAGTNFRPNFGIPTDTSPIISIGGPGGGRTDPRMFPGGSRTFDERGETLAPVPLTEEEKAAFGPPPPPGAIDTRGSIVGQPAYTTGSVVEPTPDLVATATVDPVTPSPTQTMPVAPNTIDPIIMGQTADEVVTDPLIRALYFGTPDQPGFFNQLQQVGANLLGAQAPGTEYDPSMTEKFFNPFEDRVVQQTIEDVLKAGEQRDIAQRAQDIGRGGLSAFGSRARLTADERQEALGRGLGQALAGIRQSGFSEAQRTGLSEFDRQYGRDISQLYRPLEILRGIGGLLPGYTQATSRIGTTYGMPQDPSALGLGAALSTYASLAPQTGSAFDNYGQTTGQG